MFYRDVKDKLLALFAPDKLAQAGEWGLFGEWFRDIKKIGYATNLTPETIGEAARLGADMIITHHDAWDFVYGLKDACRQMLEKHGISHAFFHAPIDDADFGTSASLANALKLQACRKAIPYQGIYMAGVIGELTKPLTFEKLSGELAQILDEPIRSFYNRSGKIRRVCIVAGGGNMTQDIKCAVDDHCHAYITGEYALYSQMYARFAGINLFVGSHTNTEIFGVESLVRRLTADTDMACIRLVEYND